MATSLFMTRPGPLPTQAPTVPGFELRVAVPGDRVRLAHLLAEAFADATWTPERVDSELLANDEVPRTWLVVSEADPDGPVLATASELLTPAKYGDAGCVHWVASGLAARGQGLGPLVTTATLAGFAERGCPSAVLNTDDGRPAAVRVYLQLGFVPTARTEEDLRAWSALLPQVTGRRPAVAAS